MKRSKLFGSFVMATSMLVAQNVSAQVADSTENNEVKQEESESFNKFRMGGYGEILFSRYDYGTYRFNGLNGSPYDERAEFTIPRFIIAMDYKFTPSIILSSEIEFEYGGTGTGVEYEGDEAGEYEMEVDKAGEVALEQFHITKVFAPWLKLRAGHMIVPVGLTNTHHEPNNFFGSFRPMAESELLPCTWHETGLAILGSAGSFDYQLMAVTGLDPLEFDRDNFIGNGSQNLFENVKFTDPAFAGRVDFFGITNTRIGVSAYYAASTSGNAARPSQLGDLDIPVTIISADVQYKGKRLTARANYLYGHIGDTPGLNKVTRTQTVGKTLSLYAKPGVASEALSFGVEAGYDVASLFKNDLHISPFVRYEYYNSMYGVDGNVVADPRLECKQITFGLNYNILPNLLVKCDYAHRIVGDGDFNNENTFSVGMAYTDWFISK